MGKVAAICVAAICVAAICVTAIRVTAIRAAAIRAAKVNWLAVTTGWLSLLVGCHYLAAGFSVGHKHIAMTPYCLDPARSARVVLQEAA